jgi:tetratricopeptide (TPR) repeat protein
MSNLISSFNLNNKGETSLPNEKIIVFVILSLYLICSWIYGLSTNATWDDDCPTRYYNTLNAFNEPRNFISVWNRPLFVVIFAPLVPLGKWVFAIVMPLICASGAYYLYKAVQKLKVNHAFLVVPLLLFQPYFFSLSRNAETEPLAVTIFALGFYFLVHRKWFWFALIGGLIPLARLELSVLLIFWAWYLISEKQFKYLIYLAVPTILWNIAGGIITGDYFYVINETIGKDNSSNRYGHTGFGHYFQRYIYVVGPIIYLLFLIGIGHKIKSKKWDAFVLLQFIAGFMMYVIFSWKLNIGNAAGFLRNLTPLAPFVALIALEGYNYFWFTFSHRINPTQADDNLPAKTVKTYSDDELQSLSSKKRKIYYNKLKNWESEVEKVKSKGINRNRKHKRKRLFLATFILLIIGSVYYFHSFEIKSHHVLKDNKDYINLYVISGMVLISFLGTVFYWKNILKKKITFLLAVFIGLISLSFSLITEPPNAHLSPERQTVEEIAEIYDSIYQKGQMTYVNHPWFFWAKDFDKSDINRFKYLTLEGLGQAKENDICIHESHYSHRLSGDVPKNYFQNRIDWVELTSKMAADRSFKISIFQKTDSTVARGIELLDSYIDGYSNDPVSHFNRAQWYEKAGRKEDALKELNLVLEMDSSFVTASAYFRRGLAQFNKEQYKLAIEDFQESVKMNSKAKDAYYNIAISHYRLKENDSSLHYLDKTIELDEKYEKAYHLRWIIYKTEKNIDKALQALNQLERINPLKEEVLLNKAQIYYNQKDWKNTIATLNKAIKVNPENKNSLLVRGNCYINTQNIDAACTDWKRAYSLGETRALKFIQTYCKSKDSFVK